MVTLARVPLHYKNINKDPGDEVGNWQGVANEGYQDRAVFEASSFTRKCLMLKDNVDTNGG